MIRLLAHVYQQQFCSRCRCVGVGASVRGTFSLTDSTYATRSSTNPSHAPWHFFTCYHRNCGVQLTEMGARRKTPPLLLLPEYLHVSTEASHTLHGRTRLPPCLPLRTAPCSSLPAIVDTIVLIGGQLSADTLKRHCSVNTLTASSIYV